MPNKKVPLKAASPSTPTANKSAIRKRQGVTIHQKQALIDNLQLEITERARRLRSQYNLQGQGLRSRIEIRVNRIPTSLRKMKIGDLLLKYENQAQKRVGERRPPVPAKDLPPRPSPIKAASDPVRVEQAARSYKRMSNEISGDKENAGYDKEEQPKKKARGGPAYTGPVRPGQVLSPTSSNSRLASRDRPVSPAKPQTARPGSPLKTTASRTATATNMLSNMVEKAKASRAAGARKVTASSAASTASSAGAPARGRPPAAARKAPAGRPATRTGRRVSDNSEISEGSATTNAAQRAAVAKTPATSTKKGVLGSMKKGMTANAQAKAPVKAPAAKSAAGRSLRKRAA